MALTMVANTIRTISGSTALGTILAQMAKLRFSKFANCHPIQFLIAYDALKQGNCIELDTDYAQQFYVDVRNQYEHLLRCGLLDDDQIILLMCHYEKPDIYCCLPSRWFSMLDEYRDDKKTGMHSDLLPEFFIISRRRRWYWTKHCLKFLKQEFNHLVRRYPL